MLRSLAIRDFAIVERVELELGPGFTVLTGETGAGKSILVDAIELLVGGRGDAAVVRDSAERAELCAEFDIGAHAALAGWLAASELEGDAGALILRRTLDRGGRSRSFINGHAVTLAQLREAGEHLVDIHGQHEHQSLLRAPAQRALLDAHADAVPLAREAADAHRALHRLQALTAEAQARSAQRAAERSEVEDKVGELGRLALREGEWDELAAEHSRLAHGSALLAGAQAALDALSEAEGACLGQLAAIASRLRVLCAHDAQLRASVELLESAEAQAGEAARELRHYAERIELDPQALRALEARIEVLHGAARRYRVRPAELPGLAHELEARLAELTLAVDAEALQRELAAANSRYHAAVAMLSAKRVAAARSLSKAVSDAMQRLAMAGGRFAVSLHPLAAPGASGAEEVEFDVAAHASLALRPLAKVASGGELSRISLAVQLVASHASPVGTLIFDEVDAGIGGAVAETVGRSLKRLGRDRQVLCVTHLPQVAAQGDEQWSVARLSARGRIISKVARLDRAGRVEELARMLGGSAITAATRRHAAEMLGK